MRHPEFLDAGARLYAIDVDSPGRHAAMVEKLGVPFPMLSDPDRSAVIEPWGLADPADERGLARPAMVLVDDLGDEQFRFVSRDFADRLPEDDALEAVRTLGAPSVDQPPPEPGVPDPGPRAMPLDGLPFYLRGARFAALALGLRHGHLDPAVVEDSKAYVEEMDRYTAAVAELRRRRSAR
jgi:hypothetical protein